MVFIAEKVIGTAIITDIAKNIYVSASDRILDLNLALAIAEAHFFDRNNIAFVAIVVSELADKLIYLSAELFAAFEDNKSHFSVILVLCHNYTPLKYEYS
jgi:hypothetical protein